VLGVAGWGACSCPLGPAGRDSVVPVPGLLSSLFVVFLLCLGAPPGYHRPCAGGVGLLCLPSHPHHGARPVVRVLLSGVEHACLDQRPVRGAGAEQPPLHRQPVPFHGVLGATSMEPSPGVRGAYTTGVGVGLGGCGPGGGEGRGLARGLPPYAPTSFACARGGTYVPMLCVPAQRERRRRKLRQRAFNRLKQQAAVTGGGCCAGPPGLPNAHSLPPPHPTYPPLPPLA
jgi:hypothetical protein